MAKELTAKNQGKRYQVTQVGQQFGPWVHPAVFTEHGFAQLHPIPTTDDAKSQIDPDTYHDDLLWRAQELGNIVETEAEPTPLPAGPHQLTANQSIRDSVADHKASVASRVAAGQEDVRQRNADPKVAPASSTPPVVNAAVTGGPGSRSAEATKK